MNYTYTRALTLVMTVNLDKYRQVGPPSLVSTCHDTCHDCEWDKYSQVLVRVRYLKHLEKSTINPKKDNNDIDVNDSKVKWNVRYRDMTRNNTVAHFINTNRFPPPMIYHHSK